MTRKGLSEVEPVRASRTGPRGGGRSIFCKSLRISKNPQTSKTHKNPQNHKQKKQKTSNLKH